MLISFAVTVFNKRRFLPRVLAAIEAERTALGGGEVVLVDDGSADGGAEWLAAFAASVPGVRLFAQANAGVAAATNRVLSLCGGEFVRLVDADDLLVPGGTAAMLAALGARPDAVAAFGAAGSWELGAAEPPALPPHVPAEALRDPLRAALRSQLFVPSAMLARRTALARCLPLDERFRTGQDFALSLRLARLGGVLRLTAETALMATDAGPGRLSASKARMYADSARIVAAEWGGWGAGDRRFALRRAALRAALYARRHLPPSSRMVALHAVAMLGHGPWRPGDGVMEWVARAYAPALADPARYP